MRNKLLISLMAFAFVPALLLAALLTYSGSESVRRMHVDRMRVVASAASASVQEVISQCKQNVRLQSSSWNMREFLLLMASNTATSEQKAESAELVRQNFIRYAGNFELFDDFVLIDASGTVVLGGDSSLIGRDLSGAEYFTAHLNHISDMDSDTGTGPVYSGRAHDSLTNPHDPELKCLPLSICIRHQDGSLRHVLVGFVNAKKLGGIASGVTFGETGTAYLVDANNYIFNHSDPRFMNTYTVAPDMADLVGRHLAGEIARNGLIEFPLDGIPRLYYYDIMPELRLAVILRQDAAELGGALRAEALVAASFVLLAFGLSAVAALLCAGKLAEPMALLRELHAEEMAREKEKAEHLAGHDHLTGLLNRPAFDREFAGLLSSHRSVGVILLKLERFRHIGDYYGRLTGDLALTETARRLGAAGFEACARVGGAQFMLAKAGGAQDIAEALQSLRGAFEAPFDGETTSLTVDFSSGSAIYPQDGQLIDLLISNADIALAAARALAKETETGADCFYSPKLREAINRMGAVTEALRGCVALREIFLMYRPFYHLSDNTVSGFEALMRLRNRNLGLISPDEFIPVAEKDAKLIVSLGDWALDEACRFLRRASDQKGFKGFVSVNIFAAQLREPDFAEKVLAALNRHGVSPTRLRLEITENMAVRELSERLGLRVSAERPETRGHLLSHPMMEESALEKL